VSGPGRPVDVLRSAAAPFDRDAERVFVRAYTGAQPQLLKRRGDRELTVSNLAELRGLLTGAMS
jgi:hypothetical protein